MTETIPSAPPIQPCHLKNTNLSFSQESLWFLQQLDPENTAYNSNLILKFTGKIDPPSLEQALNELVRRHEPFRTTYPNKAGKPIQVIHSFEPFSLPDLDFSGLPEDEQAQAVQKYFSIQGNQPFDLQEGPLVRFALLHLEKDENYLFFSTHHISTDAWSRQIVISELMQLYEAFRSGSVPLLPYLPVQYTDYAIWQRKWMRGETLATYINHWKNILSGDLPILEIPTDRPRPALQSFRGAAYRFQIPQVLSSQMTDFCKREHLTLFQLLLAAYALLLKRYTGLEDIIIGCPFANRSRPELNGLVGLFVNTLPIRMDLRGNPSVRTFLKEVREVMLDAFSWQAAPFEALVSEISPQRDLSHTPVFQVLITLRNVPKHQTSIEGLKVESILQEKVPSQFDISLEFDVGEDGQLEGSFNYNVDLYDANTIMLMNSHYHNLLMQLLTNSDCLIADLEMLSPSERQRTVIDWNDTYADYPREKSVHQLIEEQVERTPDFPAVLFGDQKLTYREVNERANRIAHFLRKMGAGPEKPVGLYLERSAEMVVAMLGILKSGSPFVPLDGIYPVERRAGIIHDSGLKILVTQAALATDEFKSGLTLLLLDGQLDQLEAESTQNPVPVVLAENLAYIMFTSGSTGNPKGVEISHRSLVNCLLSANKIISLSAGNLSIAVFSPVFDVSVFDLLSPLCLGATVLVASGEEIYNGALLAKRIMELPLTWMSASPATWQMLLETGWQGKAGLKIISTGESLPPGLADRLTKMVGEVYNLYGPTEATIWCAAQRLIHGQPVTIGRPIANTSLYILDSHLRPVPVGVTGELYIGGAGLARGYHNLPKLTTEKFLPDPFHDEPGGRIYRTGDLARYQQNGEIFILGRSDSQVKIRGYRIELGEIEVTIGQYPGIRQSLVMVREDLPGDKRLVAYLLLASNETLHVDKLRGFLREKLPDYMVPSTFVQIDAFPLTASGKIDRKTLPPPEAIVSNKYLPPQTEQEIQLTKVWETVLGISPIGVEDDFFDIGGNSLMAIRLCMEIEKKLNVRLPVAEFFRSLTIRQVSAKLHTLPGGVPLISPRRVDRSQPILASSSQRGLWFQYQLEGPSSTYNIPFVYHIRGRLALPALEKSFHYLIARHDSLRLSFKAVDGEPYLVIAENVEWELEIHPSSGENVQRELVEIAARPFSLEKAPLFRAHLWTDSSESHTLLLNFHHTIMDEWSKDVFERELKNVYSKIAAGEQAELPALELDFPDFAAWERSDLPRSMEFKQGLAYWKKTLCGAPELLDLPTDYPRPAVQTYRGSRVLLDLGPSLVDLLNGLARSENVTLFMVFYAAYAILLGRYCRQDDLVIGVPLANRLRKSLEGVVGFFVNTLPFRVDLSGSPSLSEALQRMRQVALDAYAHQDVPFDKLVEELHVKHDAKYSPVFQTLFALERMPSQNFQLGNSTVVSEIADINVAKFDLSMFARTQVEGLRLELEYNAVLFERATAERMLVYYRRILEWMVSAPTNGIHAFDLIAPDERHRILEDWSGTTVKYESEICIHQMIETQAEHNPDAPAIAYERSIMTYHELDQRANQLAHYLRSQGVGPDVLVGIFMERTPDLIVALLGVLKAGGAYLPLDVNFPVERLKIICRDAHLKLILSQLFIHASPPEIENVPLINLDTDWDSLISSYPMVKLNNLSSPTHLAYVLFTSGTTGFPKGVAIPHGSTRGMVEWIRQTFSPQELSGVLASTSIGFDMSGFEIFGSLAWGGCLILVENLFQVMTYNGEYPISLINTVPSAIAELLRAKGIPPSVRTIVLAGEPLPTQLVDKLSLLPGIQRIFDSYGPTETSYSTLGLRKAGNRPVIGKPLPGWKVYILDDNLHLMPAGIPGEIFIGGVGLARGYYGHPELTEERFLLNPYGEEASERFYRTGDLARWLSDGNIEYLGRMDHQVKIRGFRVELGEIENVLSEHPFVRQAIVVLREDQPGDKRLVAYIIPNLPPDNLPSVNMSVEMKKLRDFLQAKLPNYMVPSTFVTLDTFPLTTNGKINRKALPAPLIGINENLAVVPPHNQTEQILSLVWMDVLRIPRVSMEDNFFDLGGNSLLAIKVMARIQDALGIIMPIKRIFEFPRLAQLAEQADLVLHNQKRGSGLQEGLNDREEFIL
ncbi:MAG: amino acid adenylation domain-containing protein [Anaerolineales bacterium]